MKNKGFTIVELLAVITIIAVISIIGVIAVSNYTEQAHKDVYIDNAKLYINAARNKYNSDKIAQEPRADEALIVPISTLDVDKSIGFVSPYDDYVLDRCYVIITRVNNKNTYYISLVDQAYIGLDAVKEEDLSTDLLITDSEELSNVKTLSQLKITTTTMRIEDKDYTYLSDLIRNNSALQTFILRES